VKTFLPTLQRGFHQPVVKKSSLTKSEAQPHPMAGRVHGTAQAKRLQDREGDVWNRLDAVPETEQFGRSWAP
jgi:hypothetical protein